jgi:hypothetical protein
MLALVLTIDNPSDPLLSSVEIGVLLFIPTLPSGAILILSTPFAVLVPNAPPEGFVKKISALFGVPLPILK